MNQTPRVWRTPVTVNVPFVVHERVAIEQTRRRTFMARRDSVMLQNLFRDRYWR